MRAFFGVWGLHAGFLIARMKIRQNAAFAQITLAWILKEFGRVALASVTMKIRIRAPQVDCRDITYIHILLHTVTKSHNVQNSHTAKISLSNFRHTTDFSISLKSYLMDRNLVLMNLPMKKSVARTWYFSTQNTNVHIFGIIHLHNNGINTFTSHTSFFFTTSRDLRDLRRDRSFRRNLRTRITSC